MRPRTVDDARENNFGYSFRDAVALRPEAPALIEGDVVLSYRELDARVDRVAGLLAARGLGPGDRVASLFDNQLEAIELTYGAMRAGTVPVPLNTRMALDRLRGIVEHCSARLLVAGRGQVERAVEIARRIEDGDGVGADLSLLLDAEEPPRGESLARAMKEAPSKFTPVAVDPDDVCMQPYTSGSTGTPKGVLLTHAGSYWCVDTLRRIMLLEPDERALVAVPLYHKNAMLGAVKPFLTAGGSVVVLPEFDAEEILRTIEARRITYLTGVPAMYKLMLQAAQRTSYDVSSLRWGIIGSAEVPEEIFSAVEETFDIVLRESYGITEGGPEVALTPRWGVRRPGWAGLPIPGVEVRVVDPEDPERELPEGELGELLVRSPGVAKGYYDAPDQTRSKFLPGGWLRTHDLVRQDADGFIKVEGRVDDMINVGGEHAFPKEVEDRLLGHPSVVDACVVPQAHPVKGEAPAAFVIVDPSAVDQADEEELKRWCIERGPAFAHPRNVYFVDELPLGGTGKVDRRALEEDAASRLQENRTVG